MTRVPRAAAVLVSLLLALATPVLAAGPTGTAAAVAVAGTPAVEHAHRPRPAPKVLLVGLDGAAFARFRSARMPALDRLRRQGLTATSLLPYPPGAPTLSGPGWSSVLTGTWPAKHHVRDNFFRGARFDRYPDVLTRVERARPRMTTAGFSIWDPITERVLSRAVDLRSDSRTDTQTTAEAVSYLRRGDADATFVHLCEADHAGHAHGASSRQYAVALTRVDHRIGRLLAAVRARATYERERWLVLVTADHGMRLRGGHGGGSPIERRTFVVAVGPGTTPGSRSRSVEVVDLAPTVLRHLGIPVRARWGLDGRAL